MAHFLFLQEMRGGTAQLTELVTPVVEGLGYELVGLEYAGGQNPLLRVYIDAGAGITVDDCQKVSNQLSGVLDVEDPLPGGYVLEVSSPGMDRPLFTREHFERFRGSQVRVRMRHKILGRRNFSGVLSDVEGDLIVVEVDGEPYELPLEDVDKANLIPDFG